MLINYNNLPSPELQVGTEDEKLKIEKLVEKLESTFRHTDDSESKYQAIAKQIGLEHRYLISNDMHYQILDRLKEIKPIQLQDGEISCGLVIGESNFVSLASTIQKHAKLWLVVDIDPLPQEHLLSEVQCVRNNKKIAGFFNDHKKNLDSLPKIINFELYKNQMAATMRDNQFFKNQEKYDEARQALKEMKIIYLKVNLFDPEETDVFANILKLFNAKITLFNLTNLHTYALSNDYILDVNSKEIIVANDTNTFEVTMKLNNGEYRKVPRGDLNYGDALLKLVSDLATPTIHSDGAACLQKTDVIKIKDYFEGLSRGDLSNFSIRSLLGSRSIREEFFPLLMRLNSLSDSSK